MLSQSSKQELTHYFTHQRDIAFAFLYGSQANGNATTLSDVDVAVYFYPKNRHPVEYEESVYYKREHDIWTDLERILKKEVELLVLNRCPASVAASAIRGMPLAVNDWGMYLDFMVAVTDEAEDFEEWVIEDYRQRMNLEKRDKSPPYQVLSL